MGSIFSLTMLIFMAINGNSLADNTVKKSPWIVSIVYKGDHICVGTIITRRAVLTAGSCAEKSAKDLKIRVEPNNYLSGGLLYDLDYAITPEKFEYESHTDDIGILITTNDIKFGKNNKPMALESKKLESAHNGSLGGHYKGNSVSSPLTEHLLFEDFTICENQNCIKELDGIFIPDKMYCGHPVKKMSSLTCKVDIGGPMIVNDTLRGIITWGNGCGPPDPSSIFTAVHYYIKWIKEALDKNGVPNNIILN